VLCGFGTNPSSQKKKKILEAAMDATQLTKTADPAAARSSVEPLYYGRTLSTGESVMAHADGVANILRAIRNDPELISAAYLFSVPTLVQKPDEWIEKSFGENVAGLVRELGKMNDLSKRARSENKESSAAVQPEALRRMFLAMSQDLRVVLLKLASRLQTLRWFVSSQAPGAVEFGEETLAVYAPLANRLGIWQIKWELEDLSLRFTHPAEYHQIAAELDESREERLEFMALAVKKIQALMISHGIQAEVSGRPKHIYSIWKKMQRKHLRFDQLFDVESSSKPSSSAMKRSRLCRSTSRFCRRSMTTILPIPSPMVISRSIPSLPISSAGRLKFRSALEPCMNLPNSVLLRIGATKRRAIPTAPPLLRSSAWRGCVSSWPGGVMWAGALPSRAPKPPMQRRGRRGSRQRRPWKTTMSTV